MFRIIFAVCLVVVFFSCKHGEGDSGPHLAREVMQKVLLDVNLAEAYCISTKDSMHRLGTKNVDSLSAFYQRIFEHYKITEQEFNTSLEWYKYHPAELDSIYAKLIPIVSTWQSRMPPVPQQATPPPAVQRLPAMHAASVNTGALKRPLVPAKNTGGKPAQN